MNYSFVSGMRNKENGRRDLGIGRFSLSLCLLFLFLSFAGNLWAQPQPSDQNNFYVYRLKSTTGAPYQFLVPRNDGHAGTNNGNAANNYWFFVTHHQNNGTNYYYLRNVATGKYLYVTSFDWVQGNVYVGDLGVLDAKTYFFSVTANYNNWPNIFVTPEGTDADLDAWGGNVNAGLYDNGSNSQWTLEDQQQKGLTNHSSSAAIVYDSPSDNGIQLTCSNPGISYHSFTFSGTTYYTDYFYGGNLYTTNANDVDFANPTISWSITSGSEYATISNTGVLTSTGNASSEQTVTVKCTMTNSRGISCEVTKDIKITDVPTESPALSLSGPTVINQLNQSQQVQANWSGTCTPAYVKFMVDGQQHAILNSSDYGYNPQTLYSLDGCTLTWSLSGDGAPYATVEANATAGKVTYTTLAPNDVLVGVSVEVTHPDFPTLHLTAGPYYMTLYSTNINPPTINYTPGETNVVIEGVLEGTTYYTLDGTDPTTGSAYFTGTTSSSSQTVTLANSPTTIKAFTARWGQNSTIAELTVTLKCAKPTFTYSSGHWTITSATTEATIYYTTDGTTPSTSSSHGTTPVQVTASNTTEIKAFAAKEGWDNSDLASNFEIYSLSEITNNSGFYRLGADIEATNGTGLENFSGTLDGNYHKITGLTQPLFKSLNSGTVKNLILDNVNLTSSITTGGTTCLGAIAGKASGTSKIYNCGVLATTASTVRGGDNTGSLVGYIEGNTRVINNYSYANVSGAQYVGGIVGRNNGTALSNSNATSTTTAHTAVANNIFYGNLSGTSNVSPVYGGNHTSNVQDVNEYNFWRTRADVTYNNYNDQLAIDKDEFLNRFPFYRHILNTHRELAAIYLFGSASPTNVAEIGHWYNLPNSEAMEAKIPYMILQPWPSNTTSTPSRGHNNVDLPNTTENYAGRLLTEMGGTSTNAGYLKVNMSINGTSVTDYLPITDMDTNNFDYTWGKVKLPFVNEYSGWTRDYDYICTGWKITSVTGGTTGTFSNYNFADRNCTAKDIYTTGGFAFAQGGNYIVPYGVTEINMTANFARAYYLRDATYDVSYNNTYEVATGVCGNVSGNTYHGKTIYTDLTAAMDAFTNTNTDDVHQQAIVLVGNYHYNQSVLGDANGLQKYTSRGLTIMSVDEDNNQEPDYGFYCYLTGDKLTSGRTRTSPLRFDFVPIVGLGMSSRVTNSTPYPLGGVWNPTGWFEFTETSLYYSSEFELNAKYTDWLDGTSTRNRWILNSGYFQQIVGTFKEDCINKIRCVQIGGNAYVKQLYPGSHTDRPNTTTLIPINVTGGEVVDCFMTGYTTGATMNGSNIYFWCSGGKIHKYLSSYLETTNNNTNVTVQVDHAYIYRFFGGGTSASAPITGNINVTINNSFVQFYCGGPEFGNMSSGKTVTTNATGTTFGEFYGAGFGGNSYTLIRDGQAPSPNFGETSVTFPIFSDSNYFNRTRLAHTAVGFGVGYDFEFFMWAGGTGSGVARTYTKRVNFSLAKVPTVTSNLTDCVVLGNFCGGGCQGQVDNGNVNSNLVTSTLNNCTVYGSVFGAGYKAPATTVEVYPTTLPGFSTYIKEQGVFTDFDYSGIETETYTWVAGTGTTANQTNKTLPSGLTQNDLDNLGYVNGNVTLTINNSEVRGSVFGGGNESKTMGNTHVTVKGDTHVFGNVYGGGNAALVGGNTHVDIGGE